MLEINLIGGGFQHAYSSTWWKKSKYINWIKNQYISNISFYVDNGIVQGLNDNFKGKKYAWLHESKTIHGMDNFFYSNIEKILNTYELIFTNDFEHVKINPTKIKFIIGNGFWVENPALCNKNKNISIITSNKKITSGQKLRFNIIEKYKGKIDLYGHAYKSIKIKDEGLKDYMFSFAIENDKYDAYFSEKILDCFATGTIPIYWGSDKIIDFFNKDGIIFLEDFDFYLVNKDYYETKKDAIKENYEKVLKIEIPEDIIYENYLKYL